MDNSFSSPSYRYQYLDLAWYLPLFLFWTTLLAYLQISKTTVMTVLFLILHNTHDSSSRNLYWRKSIKQVIPYIIKSTDHSVTRHLGTLQRSPGFLLQSFLQYGDHIDWYRQLFSGVQTHSCHGHCKSPSRTTEEFHFFFFLLIRDDTKDLNRLKNCEFKDELKLK